MVVSGLIQLFPYFLSTFTYTSSGSTVYDIIGVESYVIIIMEVLKYHRTGFIVWFSDCVVGQSGPIANLIIATEVV